MTRKLGLTGYPASGPPAARMEIPAGATAALCALANPKVPLALLRFDPAGAAPAPAKEPTSEDGHELGCAWPCGPEDLYCPMCGSPRLVTDVRVTVAGREEARLRPGVPFHVWDDELREPVRVVATKTGWSLRKPVEPGTRTRLVPLFEVSEDPPAVAITPTEEGKTRLAREPIPIDLSAQGPPEAPSIPFRLVLSRRPELDLVAVTSTPIRRDRTDSGPCWRVSLTVGEIAVVKPRLTSGALPPPSATDSWVGAGTEEDPPLCYRLWIAEDGTPLIAFRWLPRGTEPYPCAIELAPGLRLPLLAETYKRPLTCNIRSIPHLALEDPCCRLPVPFEVREEIVIDGVSVRGLDRTRVLTSEGVSISHLAVGPGPMRLLLEVDATGRKGPLPSRVTIEVRFSERHPPADFRVDLVDPVPFERHRDYLSIDFGTTATCCAVSARDYGLPPMALMFEGEQPEVPSALFFEDASHSHPTCAIGEAARRRAHEQPSAYVEGLKRRVLRAPAGVVPTVWVRDARGEEAEYAVERLLELYLRALIRKAQDTYSREVLKRARKPETRKAPKLTWLNLTFPLSAPATYREVLKRVAHNLNDLDGVLCTTAPEGVLIRLDESSAGALSVLATQGGAEERFVVLLDGGGGTLEIVLLAFRRGATGVPEFRPIASAYQDELSGEELTARIADVLRQSLLGAVENEGETYPWHRPGERIASEQDRAGLHNWRSLHQVADFLKTRLLGMDSEAGASVNLGEPIPELDATLMAFSEPNFSCERPLHQVVRKAREMGSSRIDLGAVTAAALDDATGWRQALRSLWEMIGRMVEQSNISPSALHRVVLIGRGCKLRWLQETAREVLPWLSDAGPDRLFFDAKRAKTCVGEGAAALEGRVIAHPDILTYPLLAGPEGFYETRVLAPAGSISHTTRQELEKELAQWPPSPVTTGFQWTPRRWIEIEPMVGRVSFYLNSQYDPTGLSASRVCLLEFPAGLPAPLRGFLVKEEGKPTRLDVYARGGEGPPQHIASAEFT